MTFLYFWRSALFQAASSDFHSLPTSQEVTSEKKKVITSLADARDTTALEFKIIIILTPHLVPPALVFRTPKGYRYPRLRTPALTLCYSSLNSTNKSDISFLFASKYRSPLALPI